MDTIETSLLAALSQVMPIAAGRAELARGTGFVIVDEVNGFATVGAGPLAPGAPNAAVAQMIRETNRLAQPFASRDWPILAFLDSHEPGKAEPPYPPHCEIGTGQENLVPELAWLAQCDQAQLMRKDCINGYIGAERADGGNVARDCIRHRQLFHYRRTTTRRSADMPSGPYGCRPEVSLSSVRSTDLVIEMQGHIGRMIDLGAILEDPIGQALDLHAAFGQVLIGNAGFQQ